MALRALLVLSLLFACGGSAARADVLLRMAAIAPDGASWTRELKAFAREIESRTNGRVRMKWYWGAIAGDELEVVDRIKRDQLDGQAGAQVCDRLAPSLRVTRVLGLFQNRDEAEYVLARMHTALESEFRQSGFIGYVGGMGTDILFTRRPVRSLAELRKTKSWLWSLDDIMIEQFKSIGLPTFTSQVGDALHAYDDGSFDAFMAIPTAALAFQWSARARYFTDLRIGFLPGCLILANRAFDQLSLEEQQVYRDASAKLLQRFEDLGRAQDQRLLSGLFARQGLRPMPPSEVFRAEFFAAAEEARQHVPPRLVAPALLQRVGGWLADYRAQHR
jgi:TRAP-type C4-dicarboxylate transport system substrate-binding protein